MRGPFIQFAVEHGTMHLFTKGKITVSVRDHQAMVDLLIDFSARDFLCSRSIMDKRTNPVPVYTALQICAIPMLGIYAKLRALQSQLVIEKLRETRYVAERKACAKIFRDE